jgi:NAD(P)-dependent dehydrogenase (short-subunit alcohol dehydrogenase family)
VKKGASLKQGGKGCRDAVHGAKVEAVQLDLANLGSVRDASSRLLDSGRPLDVLVNNAGVMACPELRTDDGFELQLGVNHLGHFALTLPLLPLLSVPDRFAASHTLSRDPQAWSKGHFTAWSMAALNLEGSFYSMV